MRVITSGLAGLAAVAAFTLGPGVASAQTGAEFGQHVRECAQTTGFSGTHNPGTHQGFAGWDGVPCET